MDREYQSEEIQDLAAALAKAQSEMKHAEKSSNNPYFKSKYADLTSVVDAAKPFLAKNNLSVTQMSDFDEKGMFLITQLMHSTGQWLRSYYLINPIKSDPQGLGSAFTYARRYSYAAITGVTASGEDDDGNAASGKNENRKSAPTQKAPNEEWGPDEDEENYGPETMEGFVDKPLQKGYPNSAQIGRLYAIGKSNGFSVEAIKVTIANKFGVANLEDLTKQQYEEICGDDKKNTKSYFAILAEAQKQ